MTLDAGLRLLSLLNNTLDFSRMDAGRLGLVGEPFNLSQTVEQALAARRLVDVYLRQPHDHRGRSLLGGVQLHCAALGLGEEPRRVGA